MSRQDKTKRVRSELLRIAKLNRGVLTAESVVSAARSKASPLHECFEWADTRAAQLWRLHQARNLIRVSVEIISPINGQEVEVRTFVSLTTDRNSEEGGGGYRVLTTVLTDSERRKQMLSDALAEMSVFAQKYAMLKELAVVFAAIKRVSR
jgi:hypothetical protein